MNEKVAGPKESSGCRYRDIHCDNYSQCLSVTVALGWKSFTCMNCNHRIDPKLIWKAYSASKSDSLVKALCPPKELRKEIKKDRHPLQVLNSISVKTL
jgi:hypothetical protein